MKKILFIALILGACAAAATTTQAPPTDAICPAWMSDRSRMPECPASGMVPENFPIGMVIVSDMAYRNPASNFEKDGTDSEFTADVVVKTLMGAGENLPVLILPVKEGTMNAVRARINGLAISAERKRAFLASLQYVPSKGWTWQQDFMQGGVNPATGQLTLREVGGYISARELPSDTFTNIVNAASRCGLAAGATLKPLGGYESGHSGGNIETLPGGICMLGDDHMTAQSWKDYAAQTCPGGETLKVPTDWLSVGHTDEIVKVVRNNNREAPCNFSVSLASPRKARELLRQNPNERFADFTGGRGGTPNELRDRRTLQYDGLSQICFKVLENRNVPEGGPQQETPSSGTVNTVSEFKLQLFFGMPAQATEENPCATMTNGEVLRALENGSLGRYNDGVQAKMDQLKRDMQARLSARLPQCQPDFIELPDAFFGGEPVDMGNGTFELPKTMGLSILPNPTNAISINDTIITPEPGNRSFKNYISDEYRKRGLNPDFVDTFDYAHQGMGNLHCSTNTLHMCKPRGAK